MLFILCASFTIASCQKEVIEPQKLANVKETIVPLSSAPGLEFKEWNGVLGPGAACYDYKCDCIDVVGDNPSEAVLAFLGVVETLDPEIIQAYFQEHGNTIVPITDQQVEDILEGTVTIREYNGSYHLVYTEGSGIDERPDYPRVD